MSHSVLIQRRSDGWFSPLPPGGLVRPNENIRYSTSGIVNQNINSPDFVVMDEAGEIKLRQSVLANLAGNAWIDMAAPSEKGAYTLIVHAQTFPFLPFTHEAKRTFAVSDLAPVPPTPPPSEPGFLDQLKQFAWIGVILVGLVVASQVIRRT